MTIRLSRFAKELLPPLLVKALKRFTHPSRSLVTPQEPVVPTPIPIEYQYKNFSIYLPPDHKLPLYQRENLKYDRFLPHLAKFLGSNDTVIDIGANCGDTLAGMVEANEKVSYICIEPDDIFFGYLESNIQRIKNHIPGLSIQTVKSLVGKSVSSVSLEGVGGTKHAVLSNHSQGLYTAKTLDELSKEFLFLNIKVLKTDVDGFDYDVIDSGTDLLIKHKPIIFFECQTDTESQKLGFINTINRLKTIGYVDWVVFDNYGEVVLKTTDLDHIFQLINYVWQQNLHHSTRTIFYYDILANTEDTRAFVDTVLKQY